MQLFIKAAEIWQPDAHGLTLQLGSSYYGDLAEFGATSKDMTFEIGEGLPGQAWAQRRPLVWTDLDNGEFKRTTAARQAGIACGVSIPIFGGEFLIAVVVLFCGEGSEVTGAVEVWAGKSDSNTELKLADGYYGELERFEWISRRLTMMRGRGLPGGAWGSGKPLIIEDLGTANTFMRARNAAESGITTGYALPMTYLDTGVQVLTFLSAKGTPITRRIEVWTPDTEQGVLKFDSGHSESNLDVAAMYADTSVHKGEGPLGEVWLTGIPLITRLPDDEPSDEAGRTVIMLPVIELCRVVSVVKLVL